MSYVADSHLARITQVNVGDSNRVLNLWSLSLNAAKLAAFQTLWLWLAVLGAFCVLIQNDSVAFARAVVWIVALAFCVAQFGLVFTYPEWPVNRSLCQRLRRSISRRNDRPSWADKAGVRVVELVPRERWTQSCFETATDILLLHVHANGVSLEGDRDRYELPNESILGAEFVSFRPRGWFTSCYMVTITARASNGVLELPIAYRDHHWGHLRPSRRREQAIRLANQLDALATGSLFHCDTDKPLRASQSDQNPYAATAFTFD